MSQYDVLFSTHRSRSWIISARNNDEVWRMNALSRRKRRFLFASWPFFYLILVSRTAWWVFVLRGHKLADKKAYCFQSQKSRKSQWVSTDENTRFLLSCLLLWLPAASRCAQNKCCVWFLAGPCLTFPVQMRIIIFRAFFTNWKTSVNFNKRNFKRFSLQLWHFD